MTAALNSFAINSLTEAVSFHTQYQLPLTATDDEIIMDWFCGGGGASTGLEMGLQRLVTIAKNHNEDAISLHKANHPHAEHYCTDVFNGDPRVEVKGRKVGWFHMSPDCTHFTQARGGQPRDKAIRDLSWVGCKYAGILKMRVLSLENVKAILQWGPLIAKRCKETGRVIKLDGSVAAPGERVPVREQFLVPDKGKLTGNHSQRRKRRLKYERHGQPVARSWNKFVNHLKGLGYTVDWRVIKACDVGVPTRRERLYMVARRDGHPIVWPDMTHSVTPKSWQELARGAHECIDWSIPSTSIWGRTKPLAEATLRRIAKGMVKYVLNNADPFILPIANWSSADAVHSIRAPLHTVTAWPKGGAFAAVSPVFAPLTHQGSDRVNGPREPLPVVTGANRGELALFTAFLAQANGGFNKTVGHDARSPVSSITKTGSQQQLVTAHLATLRRNSVGIALNEPTPVITANGQHHALVEYDLSPQEQAGALKVSAFLMQYYSSGGQWGAVDEPLNTITTKDRLALVTVVLGGTPYVIVDIRLRMLQPHELYAAQGFPSNYEIRTGHDGRVFNKTQQVKMCGNSVCPPVMAAIAKVNDPWRHAALEGAKPAKAA